jgi:predicted CXXCH cytochrome family protein
LYASYNDQIDFLIVYIREAHPEMLKEGNKTGIVSRQPKTLDERVILASECVSRYKLTIPMVIDGMEGKVNSDYQAWPVRVTVVDIDGKVAFYGGPGPGDFRLPPVERILKKLVANSGRVPPAPSIQWGEPVNGLRCGLGIDPENLSFGEDVVVQVSFENTTNRPINLYYQPTEVIEHITISNGMGRTLQMETLDGERARMNRRGGNPPIRRIPPGQIFHAEIEGRIIADSGQAAPVAGPFNAVYSFEVNNQSLGQVEPARMQSIWTGKASSGSFALNVTSPSPTGCIDCHGDGEHHHKENQKCEFCHVGQVGNDNFDVKKESCVQCHPRQGMYGRRQILGPGGEFDMVSKHFAGVIEDKTCLLCHDNSRHRSGVVNLIDPDSGGTRPWTGTRTGFCLTCHDGQPPANISFPDKATGSGFDKMKFMDSPLAQTKEGCTFCHTPHGSPYPSLLKNLHSP